MTINSVKIISLIKKNLASGQYRSIKVKKNIFASLIIKGSSIIVSLILVPLTINYVDPSRYGIWLTLSSIVAWLSFFDIGLTQGLRNKFAEAKSANNDSIAQIYVSTTYALLCIIFFSIWILFLISNHFLNWSKILNLSENINSELTILATIVFTYFCLSFILKIINTILLADQQTAKSAFIDLLGQVFSLVLIYVLVRTTEGSLIKLGISLCTSPIIVLLGANLLLFRGQYAKYRPSISKVRFYYARSLFNLGFLFFLISFASIVQYQTANIIISRNFGTEDVTAYNIVFKYFGILSMIFTIFLTPFWSASTEAYQKNEIQWIKNGMQKYNILNVLLFCAGILMLIYANEIYKLWLGKGKVNIPFSLSVWGFVFFNISMFGSKYVYFLNGISALRIQFLSSTISPLLYVCVAIILIKYYQMGVCSLFIASIIANFNGLFLAPLQYYQIINNNKKGIWIR
jgi:O-antigen/teichoic acid export membrane protein